MAQPWKKDWGGGGSADKGKPWKKKWGDDQHVTPTQTSAGEVPVFRAEGEPEPFRFKGRPITGGRSIKLPPSEAGASFGALREAEQTTDPELKRKIFAERRGEPVENFAVTTDGDVVRRGADGLWYSETPDTPGHKTKRFIAGMTTPKGVAQTAASAAALATTGGAALPLALFGAGAIPEVAERAYQREVKGEKGSAVGAYVVQPLISGGMETAMGAGGKLTSKVGQKVANRLLRSGGRTGQMGRMLKAGDEPLTTRAGRREVEARVGQASGFGVELDTARASQSDTLSAVQTTLGGRADKAGRAIRAKAEKVKGQIGAALKEGKGGLPKTDPDAYKSGKLIAEHARGIRKHMEGVRFGKKEPLYTEAFKTVGKKKISTKKTSEFIKDLITEETVPERRKMFRQILNTIAPRRKTKEKQLELLDAFGVPMPSVVPIKGERVAKGALPHLDRIMKDDLKTRADLLKKTDPPLAKKLYAIRQQMIDEISEVAPTYKQAVDVYRRESGKIERVFGVQGKKGEESGRLLQKLADLGPDEVHRAPKMLFGREVSPQSIRFARAQYISRGGGRKAWEQMTRGAMTDIIETLPKDLKIPSWKMKNMKAALGKDSGGIKALEAFQQTMDDIASVPWPSKRVSSKEGYRVLAQKVGGVGGKLSYLTPSPYIWSRKMVEGAINKAAPKIAKELSSGTGIRNLLAIRQISNKTERIGAALAYLGLKVSPPGRVVQEQRRKLQ